MTVVNPSQPTLLRIPYLSTATDDEREFLLYLPVGYHSQPERRWPVILFLHGGGERGDGRDDLDYILWSGPLGEAWVNHRDLPFVMIGPQLPVFGQEWQLQLRASNPKPERLASGPPPRRPERRGTQPMARFVDNSPAEFGVDESWGDNGAPGGWQLYENELLQMVDRVLADYRTDPNRVYLTGLSYGGYGSWHLATTHPDRWAAVAPICGDTNSVRVKALAESQLPLWVFHGGRDIRVRPQWIYDVVNALEEAGHESVRLTIHEDLSHDCWSRVYAGQDLYDWFLSCQNE